MSIIQQSPRNATVFKPNSHYSGEFGLPNVLREKLLQKGMGDSALVLDAILYSGLKPLRWYTFRQITDKLRIYSVMAGEALIRRGLNSYLFRRGQRVKGRGRPEALYQVPEIDALVREMCDGAWMASDVLTAADFESAKVYRQALHREFIRRAPGCYSRAFLGGRLGVSKRTMRNYDRAIGIVHEERFDERRIDVYFNGEDFVAAAKAGVQWLRLRFWQTGEVRDCPAREGIYHRFKGLAEIFLVTQLSNRYWLPADGELHVASAAAI